MLNALKRSGLANRVRAAWRHDAEEATKPLRKELRRLSRDMEQLQALLRETADRATRGERVASQLRLILELDVQQREQVARLPAILDESALGEHVRAAIAAAEVHTDPFPHLVVEQLLPANAYDLLLEALPPDRFFDEHDPVKQDLAVPMSFGPALSTTTWNFVDAILGRRLIQPSVLERFGSALRDHYAEVFGPAFSGRAEGLPLLSYGGRLMLRRPGYVITPHRDPKRALFTCLMYLTRPGDSEQYGTQLYRVVDDVEAPIKQTYYPETAGLRCELVKDVPCRANSMLVFLNSHGAHGASIPADAPASIKRYAYQFYVAPDNEALGALIRDLPPDKRVMWQNRNRLAPRSS